MHTLNVSTAYQDPQGLCAAAQPDKPLHMTHLLQTTSHNHYLVAL